MDAQATLDSLVETLQMLPPAERPSAFDAHPMTLQALARALPSPFDRPGPPPEKIFGVKLYADHLVPMGEFRPHNFAHRIPEEIS